MEVDNTLDEDQQKEMGKDGKRTKWQLPPSHHQLLSSPPESQNKSKFSNHSHKNHLSLKKEVDYNDIDPGDRIVIDNEMAIENSTEISFEDVANDLATPRLSKLSGIARAEICPKIKRARLMSTKGVAAKIREQYGYDISNTTFLYAEEALYLLEIGKLELYLGRTCLSVERGRALLLHSKSHPYPESNQLKIKTCSVDEYMVYKHLSELGYRVRRCDTNHSDFKISSQVLFPTSNSSLIDQRPSAIISGHINDSETMQAETCADDEGARMELDEEPAIQQIHDIEESSETVTSASFCPNESTLNNNFIAQKGTKRKFGELSSDQTTGSTTSSAKDMSDEDADGELDLTQNNTGESYSFMETSGESPFFHPTSASSANNNYTVIEADSDVEIDEPVAGPSCISNNGVYIEELGYGYDGDIEEDIGLSQEPQASTSTAACFSSSEVSLAVVHLADSDSEKENVPTFDKIWSKFVPNSTVQMGFPPSKLLPYNIPSKETIYEFDLKSRESKRSDSDLEYYVDELTLNSSPGRDEYGMTKQKRCASKTWKEWRQVAVSEAQGVLNESLLGLSGLCTGTTDNPMDKLHLWGDKEPETKRKMNEGWKGFNIPFEIYHPSTGFHKNSYKKDVSPNYVVAVVRNDDIVLSFVGCDPLLNGIPVLIALVSDEMSITFMGPDRCPIPSLF